ncbi:Pvc16 family protein [Ornithinimicrobium pekingense]|uniref:Pvc16 N-terminal domain-containing protein n=1 Tax=Ornithinimicrobium pekingense TaxID=384677 RepID=A0ABQ2F965_9MICO|nr:Pvc16 family protein [Ornithinimicrobium pekingense]GGK63382.1 hypothetical protein GCM10011509_09730 [Ornithinimicrobium pekingense]
MIEHLDAVIRATVVAELPQLSGKVGFQPPDDAWRQRVGAGTGVWLNCALVDLRENRERRTTGVRVERDPVRRVRPPFLLQCHYLLSAWNSAKDSDAVEASVQEHALLGRVIAALLDRSPLTPAEVLLPGDLATLPVAWRETSFDTELLPPEGFPKIAEYWGTMGRTSPWRPVAWLAVTVPVSPAPTTVDGVVTSIVGSFLGSTRPPHAPTETLLDVGGVVLDATGTHAASPLAVPEATVTLSDGAGHLLAHSTTGRDGRFVFAGVPPGTVRLTARAAGLPALSRSTLTVPAQLDGPVTLTFT